MQTVSGEIEAGEANKLTSAIGARQRGSLTYFYLLQIVLVVSAMAAGYGLFKALDLFIIHGDDLDPIIGMFLGMAAGGFAYMVLGRKLLVRRLRKQIADRGQPTRFSQAITLGEDSIEMQSGRIHAVAPWQAVTEIFAAKQYWVFMVGLNPWLAPKRFFASEAEERAFVRAALSHLTVEARERSKQAVAFAQP